MDIIFVDSNFASNKELSLADRGLLCTILTLPKDFHFSGKAIAELLPDGESAVYNHLRRLEKSGYLVRENIYEDGKISRTEYRIMSDE